MLFIDFLSLYKLAFQMYTFIIMKISKSQENHIQTISYHNRVFIILYNLYCGYCHVYFCCDVTTASPFLSYHVYIPSVIHFKKGSIFNLFVYIHFWRPLYITKVAQKKATNVSNFSRNCLFKIAQLCGKTETLATLVCCTLITQW